MKNMNQIVNTANAHKTLGLIFGLKIAAKTAALSAAVMALSLSASFVLTGCGQRGALYMPTSPAAADRAGLVDTLVQPSPNNKVTATPAPASTPASTTAP